VNRKPDQGLLIEFLLQGNLSNIVILSLLPILSFMDSRSGGRAGLRYLQASLGIRSNESEKEENRRG
jgi:hypothetical protein